MARHNKFFTLLVFGIFGFLYFHLATNMLQIKTDGWYVGQINLYGDLVFHLSLINKFLASNSVQIDNPIFSGAKVGYPITADWITAIIAKSTSLTFSLFVTTFIWGILGIYVARLFIKTFIKNERIVFLSLLLFFVNGGFGFYYFFQDLFVSQKPLIQFLLSMPEQYTDIKEKGYWWINTYLAYFLPQRGFLLAFPITLLALVLLYRGLQKNSAKYICLAGLLCGTLPLVQPHSLLLIFLLSLMFFAIELLKNRNEARIKNWLIFGLITTIFSIPILKSLFDQSLSHFVFAPGWTSQENIIWFWFKNLGIFGPLLIISIFWIYNKNRHYFYLYFPFLMIFVLSNIFIFQPWNFDNSKLLVYWFFTSCILVAYFLYDNFFTETLLKKIIGTVLVSLMIFAGALDLFRTFTPVTNYKIFSNDDIKIASAVKNKTSSSAVFVTSSIHNHPVSALSGRSTLLGFHGWLWSHGIQFNSRANDLKTIYLGGSEAEQLIKKYKINYVTIGPPEKSEFSINYSYFNKFPVAIENTEWKIYDVKDSGSR